MNAYDDDSRQTVIEGRVGRDAGKRFLIKEVDPITMSGFVLRLLAALRLSQTDDLLDLFQGRGVADEGEPVDTSGDLAAILRLLTGCDPLAVHALITDALVNVEIAPDPKHPGAFRRLTATDIREMATLGDVLGGFARVNLLPG